MGDELIDRIIIVRQQLVQKRFCYPHVIFFFQNRSVCEKCLLHHRWGKEGALSEVLDYLVKKGARCTYR